MLSATAFEPRSIQLHGHPVTYRLAGEGPPLLLLHGITSSSQTWAKVLPALAEHHTVIAPDLLGHGESAKPRGDYSLGAYASGVRDLMAALGHDRATVVGHSLGGGIAMQMAYQFPERIERLVLVGSGGLGHQVTPMLRAVALPGSELVLPLLASLPLLNAGAAVGRWLAGKGLRVGSDLAEMAVGLSALHDMEARRAFVHTARSVIDIRGQKVSATDKLYLAEAVPTLLMWGEQDPIIPARHGVRAHELMPGSQLELFPHAGHFPHHDDPAAFASVVVNFVQGTEPSARDDDRLRRLVVERGQG